MAFPLYLSYLTAEQKPAACFVPTQSGGGGGGTAAANGNATASAAAAAATRPTGSAATSTASIQGQSKSTTADGAPVPVVPMDCYEDMFHEIAKKFYGEGALVQGGIVQGTDQNGTGGGNQQQQSQSELGLMDLDYQQV